MIEQLTLAFMAVSTTITAYRSYSINHQKYTLSRQINKVASASTIIAQQIDQFVQANPGEMSANGIEFLEDFKSGNRCLNSFVGHFNRNLAADISAIKLQQVTEREALLMCGIDCQINAGLRAISEFLVYINDSTRAVLHGRLVNLNLLENNAIMSNAIDVLDDVVNELTNSPVTGSLVESFSSVDGTIIVPTVFVGASATFIGVSATFVQNGYTPLTDLYNYLLLGNFTSDSEIF